MVCSLKSQGENSFVVEDPESKTLILRIWDLRCPWGRNRCMEKLEELVFGWGGGWGRGREGEGVQLGVVQLDFKEQELKAAGL